MKNVIFIFLMILMTLTVQSGLAAAAPAVRLHYLGHSSFIIRFDNGVTLLTDYGFSRSFGLPSPIYDVADFQPTIVTYSHNHQDHDRGEGLDTVYELRGKGLSLQGIEIKPFRTSEGYKNSNISYLVTYKGFTILHLGDAQGDIVNIADNAEQKLLKDMFPNRIDLLLIPIGWTKDILKEAESAVGFFRPKRVIPIHYWHKETKEQFLKDLIAITPPDGTRYEITTIDGPEYAIDLPDSTGEHVTRVISLEPQPYNPDN